MTVMMMPSSFSNLSQQRFTAQCRSNVIIGLGLSIGRSTSFISVTLVRQHFLDVAPVEPLFLIITAVIINITVSSNSIINNTIIFDVINAITSDYSGKTPSATVNESATIIDALPRLTTTQKQQRHNNKATIVVVVIS